MYAVVYSETEWDESLLYNSIYHVLSTLLSLPVAELGALTYFTLHSNPYMYASRTYSYTRPSKTRACCVRATSQHSVLVNHQRRVPIFEPR